MWYSSVGDEQRALDTFRLRLHERRDQRFARPRRVEVSPVPSEGWWVTDVRWVELVGGPTAH